LARTFEGRRAEKIERYTETSRGSSEREREREHIEADGGADTKTTTKMRKRKNQRKKKKHNRDPHMAQREAKKRILEPPPRPEPQIEHPRTSQ
jgi:hypothetical protein